MVSGKKKLQIVAAFGTLLLFALGLGCNGFFVDPVLTSIAVGPTATINQGATVQESAIGTYNDGSTQTLSSGVQWSSSSTTTAGVSNSGLVTGAAPGTATITAAYQATSGTASITVSLGNVTALKITPQTNTVTINGTTATPFFAYATVAGDSTPIDVSPTATWTVSDPTNFTINVPTTTGVGVTITAGSGATAGEVVKVTATYTSTTTLNATAQLTVSQ
jgi:trimeric autotransporter adhesin